MKQETRAAFERIKRIDWTRCGCVADDPEIERLFMEYVASSMAITKHLGQECGLYRQLSGLFNFTDKLFSETYQLPETVDEWLDSTMFNQYQWRSRWYIGAALRGYLLWFELSESDKAKVGSAASNPHELLIKFLELGGAFSCEHNIFDRVYPEPATAASTPELDC